MIKFGGLPNVIIAVPEITSFEIKSDMDFIIMGCNFILTQVTAFLISLIIMRL
jgi:hypothetical protein